MSRHRLFVVGSTLFGSIQLFTGTARSQNADVSWYAFSGGYSEGNSSGLSVAGTVGQPLIGATGNSNILLRSGFSAGQQMSDEAISAIEEEQVSELREFVLHQNYPNPFNPRTTIEYSVPVETHVRLIVFDQLGRAIRELVNETQLPGKHRAILGADGLPSGVYFYRIETGAFSDVRRLLLLK